ncbi:penicillin-binding protein activator [Desulfovibrio sp. X2]|uniref:penicillin-binding protein activator n=1 Tax=Desulfovibrio sp. X2 TaxID=941449 RepID=UPI001F258690|nr:penicillin-binding protein activator [Desulfovibrio sp. X2]
MIILVALLSLAATGCQKQPATPVGARPAMTPGLPLDDAAAQAWDNQDWDKSELYYGQMLERGQAAPAQRLQWHERYTLSALRAGHARGALEGLDAWAQADPKVRKKPAWRAAQIEILAATGETDSLRKALDSFAADKSIPAGTRFSAVRAAAETGLRQEPDASTLTLLNTAYTLAPTVQDKADLEDTVLSALSPLSADKLQSLAAAAPSGKEWSFPYPQVRFLLAARQADASSEAWAGSWQTMRGVMGRFHFAKPAPWTAILAKFEEKRGVPTIDLTLLLPLSGRFEQVGWSILRGAGAAQWQLSRQGVPVTVHVINTEDRDWLAQLSALPAEATVVGGPLEMERFRQLAASSEFGRRAVFAFMPSLGDVEEGHDAWRFFDSLEDQIRALARISVQDLGIERFAVLYPQERFGMKAAQLFQEEIAAKGGSVTSTGTYYPGDPQRWGRSVAEMLHAPGKDSVTGDRPPPPEPSFQAVFIPDGWAQAQLIVPQFFFYEQDQLLFLGPELWSQAIGAGTDADMHYFGMSVAPGSWWPENPSPGAQALRQNLDSMGLPRPDFWTALGFDFIRFGARLGNLGRDWNSQSLTRRMQSAAQMDWSLAPIAWDDSGKARENLFLFTPADGGLSPTDPQALKERLEFVRGKHDERIKALREKYEADRKKAAGQIH